MTTRYLSSPFLLSALGRGKTVAQLLSVSDGPDSRVVRHVALWREGETCVVALHCVRDMSDRLADVTEWPSVDGSEEHGVGVWTRFASVEDALVWVESELGGSRARFVNHGVIQDEIYQALARPR